MFFEKRTREATFLSPLEGFKPSTQSIEFRKDPLTKRWCRINVNRARRVKQAKGGETPEEIVRDTEKCYFCPKNLERSTPMLPPGFPKGRLKRGSAILFPNLFPFGQFHAVVVISESHFLKTEEFTSELIKHGIEVSLEYFKHVVRIEEEAKYHMLNWNYLPPAAASIIHPHFQLLADHKPTPTLEEMLQASERYRTQTGSNFWTDLLRGERGCGERLILETDRVSWLASFAPQGQNEVWIIFKEISSITEMTSRDVEEFSEGLSRVLKGYAKLGVESFNLTSFSGPAGEDLYEHYRLNFKLISRPQFRPLYTSDSGFMERFQCEPVIETLPEDLTESLRDGFFE